MTIRPTCTKHDDDMFWPLNLNSTCLTQSREPNPLYIPTHSCLSLLGLYHKRIVKSTPSSNSLPLNLLSFSCCSANVLRAGQVLGGAR